MYLKQSPLVPRELQLEAYDKPLFIPPTVLCQCLKFLCFYHLCDISNRQRTLRDLYLTVKEMNCIPSNMLFISLTILGVCCDMSGDKETSYQCYDKALQCDEVSCPTAEARQCKLLEV